MNIPHCDKARSPNYIVPGYVLTNPTLKGGKGNQTHDLSKMSDSLQMLISVICLHRIAMLEILPKQVLNSICVYTTRTIRNDDEHKYPKKEGLWSECTCIYIFSYTLANT